MTGKTTAVANRAVDDGGDLVALSAMKRTLRAESDALKHLSEGLDNSALTAVRIIESVSGRTILTGMGKSGHVARKIAATLASTGTPSFFVHPGEASHGDLGMISKGDCVIALSNSGNTSELNDLLTYCRRFDICVIGITSSRNSVLGEMSDVLLVLPDVGEACPLGLAPTTSTTLMMALGDALAIALLERQGFSSESFGDFHPGGGLGQKLLRVRDVMLPTQALPVAEPDMLVADVIVKMTSQNYGCAIIVDKSLRLVGLITDGDLRRHMSPGLLQLKASEIMTTAPQSVSPNTLAAEAVNIMNGFRITSLCVLEKDRLVGLIHMHDCLRNGVQ